MQEPARYPRVRRVQSGLPRADLPPPDDTHNPTKCTVKAEMRATAERNAVASAAPPMLTKNRHPIEERSIVRDHRHDAGS